ncbi:hypothetical protein RM09_12910 [Salmonella enterica subsp. enterica serovar Montevideo]|nr:hypothetical protein [Salmonella enterica subsp. enterica serovar Montevideo]
MAVNMKLKPKTPKKVNAAIKNILNELGVKESPVYLPLTLSENSRAGYCFNNCEDYVKSKNADVIYGWMFWEDRKNSFTEAEFHAVIKEDGKLKDITPRVNNESEILFVPDMERNHGRKNDDSWYSWANVKMFDDIIEERTHPLEIKELDDDYSEIIRL